MPYYTAMPLRRVAVLGGSNPLAPAEHGEAARSVGRLLAEQGITLVYDGGSQGAVEELAAALHAAHGNSLAVPPEQFVEHCDGFLALPGGPETLEELLGRCLPARGTAGGNEPACGLLNTLNYFSEQLKTGGDRVVELFVRESQRGRLIVERDPAELLRAMAEYRPPETRRQQP
jgi:predicted Rossmann-fold nucleotide-binding protein